MTHKHKCPNPQCGHVWEHGREAAGSQRAHECPKCGTEQWYKHFTPEDDAEFRQRLKDDPLGVLLEEIFF